jgi:hypothetical protein
LDVRKRLTGAARRRAVQGPSPVLHAELMATWCRAPPPAFTEHGETEEQLGLPERARLGELERVNRELEMKCAFLESASYRQSRMSAAMSWSPSG